MGCCQSTLCCRTKTTTIGIQTEDPKPPTPPKPPRRPRPIPFTTKAFSSEDQSLLIAGYEQEICTELREALRPVQDQVENLDEQIAEAWEKCYYQRKNNRSNISNEFSSIEENRSDEKDQTLINDDDVTRDESAALYLFTKRDSDRSTYSRVHTAIRSEDSSRIKPWFKFLNLLKRALDKIGSKKVKSFQSVVSEVNFRRWYLQIISLHMCISEASPERQNAQDCFAEKYPGETMANIVYDNVPAYDITKYSANDYPEYMLWPGIKLNIYKSEQVNGVFNFHLRVAEDHFACPIPACRNRCNRTHGKHHYCHGCVYLKFPRTSHFCLNPPKCGYGDARTFNLYACRECSGQFCADCAMKGRDPLTSRCKSAKT